MQQSVNGWSAQNHKIPKKDSKQTANHVKVYCTSIQELSECFRCDILALTCFISWWSRALWSGYHLWIFKVNTTPQCGPWSKNHMKLV